MKQFWRQYFKDFSNFFSGFGFYAIFAAYYILSYFSAIYLGDYFVRESEIMNAYFTMQPIILVLVLPAVTMRSWADEAKSGTLELLLTQPISYVKLVLAKFGAAFSFFILLAASSFILYALSAKLSFLDERLTMAGYIGLLLTGALFTAVGCLISALNRNNIISYILTIFALFFLTQAEFTSLTIGKLVLPLKALNFEDNYKAWLAGSIKWSNLVYFLLATVLCLWLNFVTIEYKTASEKRQKRLFRLFTVLVVCIFSSITLGTDLVSQSSIDATDEQKFTLSPSDQAFLDSLEKRIDIVLYLAQTKREEANSAYAVYAEFVEKTLALIAEKSHGAVRTETVLVEPFSEQERKLAYEDKVFFEEDNLGVKTYMALDFSDNEGNSYMIKTLSNLRQNLLETDIMRVLRNFGNEKRSVAVITSDEDLSNMQAFIQTLEEFYKVDYFNNSIAYIPPSYQAIIVINPTQVSTEFLLAMEQYVLSGGSLVMFSEPKLIDETNGKPIIQFLNNYGIYPQPFKYAQIQSDNAVYEGGAAFPAEVSNIKNFRSAIINGAGAVETKDQENFKTYPLLNFGSTVIAAASEGRYLSNYIEMAAQSQNIVPMSVKDGKVFFVYDSDIIKDNTYISLESKGYYFYQSIPLADNLIFILGLLDEATGNSLEKGLSYKHYTINTASIGHIMLSSIRAKYNDQLDELEYKLAAYKEKQENFYNSLKYQQAVSIQNVGNINELAQQIDKTEGTIYALKSKIANDYQTVIAVITASVTIAAPLLIFLLTFITAVLFRRCKLKKIRRFMQNA